MGITTDLGQFPLKELRRLPMLQAVPLPEVLEGKFNATIKEATLSDKGLDALVLDTQLSSGKIVVKNVAPGVSLDVSKIDLGVKDFSFGKPFHVVFKAAYMGDVPNIDLQGEVSLDMATQNIRLNNFTFTTDLALWPLEKIKAEVAPLKDLPVPQKIAGKLQTAIKELSAGPKGLDSVLLDVQLQGAEISFKDIAPGVSFDASKIDFALKNFSLTVPFQVSLQMAYLNDAQNISLDGAASYDLKTQDVRLKDMKISVDLDALSLDQLKSSVTLLKDVPLPEVLGGKFETTIKSLNAGAKGLESVLLDARLNQGKVSMKNAAPGVALNVDQIDVDVRNFSLSDPFALNAKLAYLSDTPNIAFDGTVAYNMQTQAVHLKDSKLSVDLAKLNFEQLKSSVAALKDVPLPQMLAGDLSLLIKDLSAGTKGLDAIKMDADLKNGAVDYKNIAPGVSLAASQIGLELKNVSLVQPITFHLNAAYLNASPNIDVAGTAIVDPAQLSVLLKDTRIKTDLSSFSMDELRASVVSLKDVPLPQSLKGKIDVVLEEVSAGAKGLVSLTSHGELVQGSIKLKELAVPIDVDQAKFKTVGTHADVDDLKISLGKGMIKGKLSVDEFLTKQSFNGEVVVDGIDLAELIEQKDAQVKVEGKVFANVKAQGQGSDVQSIVGDGTLEVKDAKLKDLNVLKLVLDKISIVPNLSEKVKKSLPEKYVKKLEDADTSINKVAATIAISAGQINVNPIDVEADEFIFEGQCQADFEQAYTLSGAFMIPQELAASMVSSVSELQYLLDEKGNIRFPLRVSGKGTGVPTFSPEIGDLMKNVLVNKGKEELGKVLNKVFNQNGVNTSNEPTQSGQPQEGDGSTQGGSQKSTEQQIIDGVLGTIFK